MVNNFHEVTHDGFLTLYFYKVNTFMPWSNVRDQLGVEDP